MIDFGFTSSRFNCNGHQTKFNRPLRSERCLGWLNSLASLIVDAMTERVSAIKCLSIPLRSKVC